MKVGKDHHVIVSSDLDRDCVSERSPRFGADDADERMDGTVPY